MEHDNCSRCGCVTLESVACVRIGLEILCNICAENEIRDLRDKLKILPRDVHKIKPSVRWIKLYDNTWGVSANRPFPIVGDVVEVLNRSGDISQQKLLKLVWTNETYAVYSIERSSGNYYDDYFDESSAQG